jgi:hypothetical protein
MPATTHLRRGALLAAVCAAAFAFADAASASYGWPIKPFHAQHAIRGSFGDPRDISGAHANPHFGIDISTADGTPVYATLDGVASIHPLHDDTVIVAGAGGMRFEYWHITPSIVPGEHVTAYRTVVGRVESGYGHVHFSELDGGVYVNPLRPGALAPYADRTRPQVRHITFERNGAPVGDRVSGSVDLVAEATDVPPLVPPAPWNHVVLAPALVEWRIAPARDAASSPWHVTVDFRDALPPAWSPIYARWTRQNDPMHHRRPPVGRYRYLLAPSFDTHTLANGRYRLFVRATDTRGNVGVASRAFTVLNGV